MKKIETAMKNIADSRKINTAYKEIWILFFFIISVTIGNTNKYKIIVSTIINTAIAIIFIDKLYLAKRKRAKRQVIVAKIAKCLVKIGRQKLQIMEGVLRALLFFTSFVILFQLPDSFIRTVSIFCLFKEN